MRTGRLNALVIGLATLASSSGCRDRTDGENTPGARTPRPSPVPPAAGNIGNAGARATAATQVAVGGGSSPECATALANAPAACDGHTCARMNDGTVRCWGFNANGQLGDGTTLSRATPAPVIAMRDAVSIAAGGGHTCAITRDGAVMCWGANRHGQLGDGTTVDRATPVAARGIANATSLALGSEHSCARLADGSVRCWGRNPAGQLGDGTRADHFTPVAAGLSRVTSITLGNHHGCAVRDDAALWCWGRNDHRQLADATEQNHPAPFAIAGIVGAVTGAGAGDAHSCAVVADGHVWCWGWNNAGQLGDGTALMRAAPAIVPGFEHVAEISLATGRTCARLANGTVWCTTRTAEPARVEGITDATALSVGGGHACALRNDGTLRCWGRNRAGQLGNGTMNDRADVVAVVW